MAFQISLSSNSSEIIRDYKEGIPLDSPYEVGLKHFVFWNTIYNVTSKNNTLLLIQEVLPGSENSIRIDHKVTIPEGVYELDDLITVFTDNMSMRESRTSISLHRNTMKIKISSDWIIDFTCDNCIGSILGFSKKTIPATVVTYSDLPINICSINTVKISCNLIRSNIENLKRNVNIIYDFPLDLSKIGSNIIVAPNPICYFRVSADKIFELVIKITDQDNNLIDFRGEQINLTLDFRPIR